MGYHKFTYKLEIVTGLALIQKEITADYKRRTDGMIQFKQDDGYETHSKDKTLAEYPASCTIIASIDNNPDYIRRQDRPYVP